MLGKRHLQDDMICLIWYGPYLKLSFSETDRYFRGLVEYLSAEYKRKEASGEKHNSDFASMMMANEISEEKATRKVSIRPYHMFHTIWTISYGPYDMEYIYNWMNPYI